MVISQQEHLKELDKGYRFDWKDASHSVFEPKRGLSPAVVEVGDLRLDPATHQAWRKSKELPLSAKEFAVLEAFMRRPGEVLSRNALLEAAWDLAFESRSNIVDVYVRQLREHVGAATIETVRGVGYRLRTDAV